MPGLHGWIVEVVIGGGGGEEGGGIFGESGLGRRGGLGERRQSGSKVECERETALHMEAL